jgi:hypothetical protein
MCGLAPASEGDLRPRARVLVVDDAPVNRELISALLSPFRIEIVEAGDGLEAVEAARRTAFQLVLMDLQMPGLDGFSATRAIREDCPLNRDTPIVAVTASDDVEACRAAGMNDHIAKPISPRELIGKATRWTGN